MGHRRVTPIEARFWPKVEMAGPYDCWIWTGNTDGHGYGKIGRGRRGEGMEKAHRQSWIMSYGPIPPKTDVCHKCDNPPCVNPVHLFLGSHQDNMDDMVGKDRQQRGPRHAHSKTTVAKVLEIRSIYVNGVMSQRSLGEMFHLSQANISLILQGKAWQRSIVDDGLQPSIDLMLKKSLSHAGSSHWMSKLSESQVVDIRKRYAAGGIKQVDLAKEFGVSIPLISNIVTRRSWAHVE